MKRKMILVAAGISVLMMAGCASKENDIYFSEQAIEKEDIPQEEVTDVTEEIPVEQELKEIVLNFSEIPETYAEGEAAVPLSLSIDSKEENGIDWAYEWYERKELSLPMIGSDWNKFYDENYIYEWTEPDMLLISDAKETALYCVMIPGDRWYINGNNACVEDGILYAGSVLNGYATPNSCFMFAYDLNKEQLLWRSADQTYNSMNFIVKGDVILCGYGFTGEKDYLYQIDKHTGRVLEKMSLDKMPDLMAEKDGKLYVHTYSYDYVISMD